MNQGNKFKIGLIVPSSNTVMEPDFYHNLPRGTRSTRPVCFWRM